MNSYPLIIICCTCKLIVTWKHQNLSVQLYYYHKMLLQIIYLKIIKMYYNISTNKRKLNELEGID